MLNFFITILVIIGKAILVIALSATMLLLGLVAIVIAMVIFCVLAVFIVTEEHLSELKNYEPDH